MSVIGFADPETPWPNLHPHWWLREHWGRAFEIVALRPGGELPMQGWALLRPREGDLIPEQLEREHQDDRRYHEARRFQLELARAEGEELKRRHSELVESASWRLTAPFRRTKARACTDGSVGPGLAGRPDVRVSPRPDSGHFRPDFKEVPPET